eukprot:365986-Chlamydomonas_euryale.AAC.10
MRAEFSLAPVADVLAARLGPSIFKGLAPDCVGPEAEAAVAGLSNGQVLRVVSGMHVCMHACMVVTSRSCSLNANCTLARNFFRPFVYSRLLPSYHAPLSPLHWDRPVGRLVRTGIDRFVYSRLLPSYHAPLSPQLQQLLTAPAGIACCYPTANITIRSIASARRETQRQHLLPLPQVLLLENTRFHDGDTSNDDAFASALASLCDVFVNDAFGVSHRNQASVTQVTVHVKECYAGPLLLAELRYLTQYLSEPVRPLGVIIGGSKGDCMRASYVLRRKGWFVGRRTVCGNAAPRM